jgi:hypothetical protein
MTHLSQINFSINISLMQQNPAQISSQTPPQGATFSRQSKTWPQPAARPRSARNLALRRNEDCAAASGPQGSGGGRRARGRKSTAMRPSCRLPTCTQPPDLGVVRAQPEADVRECPLELRKRDLPRAAAIVLVNKVRNRLPVNLTDLLDPRHDIGHTQDRAGPAQPMSAASHCM